MALEVGGAGRREFETPSLAYRGDSRSRGPLALRSGDGLPCWAAPFTLAESFTDALDAFAVWALGNLGPCARGAFVHAAESSRYVTRPARPVP